MNIDSIKTGVVIDHITAEKGMLLYELLDLGSLDCSVAIIKNVFSRKMEKKDIIKINADISINFDVIGYVDPEATVNIIKDGVLVEKRKSICLNA
ncbi:MAG: aspartate carbamoyltransferase regulatory subunit [Eubacteriales bacterium]